MALRSHLLGHRNDDGTSHGIESTMITEDDCYGILGIPKGATTQDIIAARRRVARSMHPDAGGSHADMVRVNEAFRILIGIRTESEQVARRAEQPFPPTPTRRSSEPQHGERAHVRDVPSFVIDALPVEAFDLLQTAANSLGEIVDEDPPYLLEALVRDPGPMWCSFELLPDAGSTTVLMSCDVEFGYRVYSVEEIRDLWVDAVNAALQP